MKRYIRASEGEKVRSAFDMPGNNHYVFQGEIFRSGPIGVSGQITKVAPYDDADYFWAKIERNGQVKFIQDRKIKDKMQLWAYEEDDYENVDEYIDDIVTETAKELNKFNRDISPRIIHN